VKLTVLLPQIPGQNFACKSCTNCCRELVVHLTPLDREKIDRQNWAGKIAGPAYVRLGQEYVLNHNPEGGCVFLGSNGRCRIHAEFGGAEKPLACQLYPFTLEPEEAGLRVGIRFDCPTVAQSEGEPLSAHRPSVTRLGGELATQFSEQFRLRQPPMLTAGRVVSARELSTLTRCLDRWLADPARDLSSKLTGLASFTDTLLVAKLGALPENSVIELIEMIADDLPNAVLESGTLPPPTARQRKLLHQAAFAHSEHISLKQARAGFLESIRYRFSQLRRARQLARSSGPLPNLSPHATAPHLVTAETLEGVAPATDPQCSETITRYLRARVSTHSFFGPAYYDWPVLDGLAALLLAIATIEWLARYFAAGAVHDRLVLADIVAAVGVVDRGAGRARELGSRSAKLRLAYLRQDAGLLRLITAYPIMAR
jgi:lysine-N-methylase